MKVLIVLTNSPVVARTANSLGKVSADLEFVHSILQFRVENVSFITA